jgi:hypothetical protein
MANILTPAEAANFVRTTSDDEVLLQFLPLVDQYLLNATGHDWTSDASIHPTAKIAAGMLITYWYDNPNAVGQAPEAFLSLLAQLEAEAAKYRKYEFAGRKGAGAIAIDELHSTRKGDVVLSITGTYGASGDQKSKFESVISKSGQLQQISADDLSENLYVMAVKHPADDVSA